jgi:YVTN family beta-propeller protein
LKLVKTIDLNQGGWERFIYGIVLADDGESAYVNIISRKTEGGEVVVDSPAVAQINLDTGAIIRRVDVPWGVANLVNVKNGRMIYAVGQDLYKIDASQKEMRIVDTYPLYDKGINILPVFPFTQENGGIFLAPYYTMEFMGLMRIDGHTGNITETPIDGEPILAYAAVYSPDKTKAYAIMDELGVIDLKTNTIEKIVPIPEGTCYSVIPTKDGSKIFVGAGGSTVSVLDAKTLKVIKVIQMAADGWTTSTISL